MNINTATKRTKSTLQEIAKEELCVEFREDHFLALGSELATLRLFKKYSLHGHQGYSENLKSFYFILTGNFSYIEVQK